jgi:hypothetical protein
MEVRAQMKDGLGTENTKRKLESKTILLYVE